MNIPPSRGTTATELAMMHAQAETKPVPETVLEEAARIVGVARAEVYGGVEDNFDRTARMWNAYLSAKGGTAITTLDVAQMMILLKMARLINNPRHRDSLVDQAGYVACHARAVGL